MIFVDTNFFLRFLLADIKDQHSEAKSLFMDAAHGKKKLLTSTVVIFELYWVLASFYKKNKGELSRVLKQILSMYFVDIEERDILQKSVDMFQDSTLDLEDSYNISYAKSHNVKDFKTFDRKLLKTFTQ